MTIPGAVPSKGHAPSLRSDPRDRQRRIGKEELALPLTKDAQDRIAIAFDRRSPVHLTPQGTLDVRVGDGLIVEVGSPPRMKIRGSDSIRVDALGQVIARPKASQVRMDTAADLGSTLQEALDSKVERLANRDVAGGYPSLDASLYLAAARIPLDAVLTSSSRSTQTRGAAILVAGTVSVLTTAITASSLIFLTTSTPGGTPGFLRVSARVAGVSFDITSSDAADTSTVSWMIFEP